MIISPEHDFKLLFYFLNIKNLNKLNKRFIYLGENFSTPAKKSQEEFCKFTQSPQFFVQNCCRITSLTVELFALFLPCNYIITYRLNKSKYLHKSFTFTISSQSKKVVDKSRMVCNNIVMERKEKPAKNNLVKL